jgi:hypothetical protein
MPRSEEELNALMKRIAKAKAGHLTLSILEMMRVATFALKESYIIMHCQ